MIFSATYSEVFFFYLLFWLLLLLILWRREEARISRNEWRISSSQLFHCDNCHHSFVNRDRRASICRCPRCNAMCIRRHRHDV